MYVSGDGTGVRKAKHKGKLMDVLTESVETLTSSKGLQVPIYDSDGEKVKMSTIDDSGGDPQEAVMELIRAQAQEQNHIFGGSVDPRTGLVKLPDHYSGGSGEGTLLPPRDTPSSRKSTGADDQDYDEVDFAALMEADPEVASLVEELREDGVDVDEILDLPSGPQKGDGAHALDLETIAHLEGVSVGVGGEGMGEEEGEGGEGEEEEGEEEGDSDEELAMLRRLEGLLDGEEGEQYRALLRELEEGEEVEEEEEPQAKSHDDAPSTASPQWTAPSAPADGGSQLLFTDPFKALRKPSLVSNGLVYGADDGAEPSLADAAALLDSAWRRLLDRSCSRNVVVCVFLR